MHPEADSRKAERRARDELTAVELRRRGFESLVVSLGWVNAVRYLQQFDTGSGNYVYNRDQFLPAWNAETLQQMSRERDQSA
jgi:hypothetical protein